MQDRNVIVGLRNLDACWTIYSDCGTHNGERPIESGSPLEQDNLTSLTESETSTDWYKQAHGNKQRLRQLAQIT